MPSTQHADHPGPVDQHDVYVATDGAGESLHTITQQAQSGSLTLMTHHFHLSRAHTNSILPVRFTITPISLSRSYSLARQSVQPIHESLKTPPTRVSAWVSTTLFKSTASLPAILLSLKWRPILGCDCSSIGKGLWKFKNLLCHFP